MRPRRDGEPDQGAEDAVCRPGRRPAMVSQLLAAAGRCDSVHSDGDSAAGVLKGVKLAETTCATIHAKLIKLGVQAHGRSHHPPSESVPTHRVPCVSPT